MKLIQLCLIAGFSIGDELGFSQSLSNLESAKRRSVQSNRVNGLALNPLNAVSKKLQSNSEFMFIQLRRQVRYQSISKYKSYIYYL